MQKRLHNFMDKMKEKPLEERRRILFGSMVVSGILIAFGGMYNLSSNLVALNSGQGDQPIGEAGLASSVDESVAKAPSLISSLSSNVASVWGAIKDQLHVLNNKLGPPVSEAGSSTDATSK